MVSKSAEELAKEKDKLVAAALAKKEAAKEQE